MAAFPGLLFEKSAAGLTDTVAKVKLRTGANAIGYPALDPRNLVVNGGLSQSYPAHSAASSYTANTDVVIKDGRQWICVNSISPKAWDSADWWPLQALSEYRLLFADLNKRTTGTVAQLMAIIRAANAGCLVFQYCNPTIPFYGKANNYNVDIYDWAVTNTMFVLQDNTAVAVRVTQSCTLTAGNATVTCADTTGIANGMRVTTAVDNDGIDHVQANGNITTVSSFVVNTSVTLSRVVQSGKSGTKTLIFDNQVTPALTGNDQRRTVNPVKAKNTVAGDGYTYMSKDTALRLAETTYNSARFDGWAIDDCNTLNAYSTGAGDVITTSFTSGNIWGTGYYRSGFNEASNNANVKASWAEFFLAYFAQLQKDFPGSLIWPNAAIKPWTDLSGAYDMIEMEGIGGASYSDEHSYNNAWQNYVTAAKNTGDSRRGKLPSIMWGGVNFSSSGTYTNDLNSAVGYRHQDMLYSLCSALLTDGVFGWTDTRWPQEAKYRAYIEEFETAIGVPIEDVPTAAWSNGVWKREYTNALILVNPRTVASGDWSTGNSKTVTLPAGPWRRLTGTRNAADDGSIVTSITLAARRGLILLKS